MPEVHRWNEALKSTHLEFSEALTAPNGKTPMPFDAWRNGARPSSTELFGDL